MLDNRNFFFETGLLVRFVGNLTFFSCKNEMIDECEKSHLSYIILKYWG
jgi:hypothetical protein